MGPLLILVGGWLFLNRSNNITSKETGRTILGLIILALSVIRATVVPLQNSANLSGAMDLINNDPVNAALLGMALTLLMHSSLVALLTAAAFLAQSAMPPVIVIGFVLGCNIGSAVLPLWLLRTADTTTKTVTRCVATLRSILAILILPALFFFEEIPLQLLDGSAPTKIVLLSHLAFNLALLGILPIAKNIIDVFTPEPSTTAQTHLAASQLRDAPDLVLAESKRGVNTMFESMALMIGAVTSKSPNHAELAKGEIRINQGLTEMRTQFARLPDLLNALIEHVQDMLDYALRIERSADILSGKYYRIRLEEKKSTFM
ncbi:MAG: hypothetical protein ABJO67_19405 [Pseudoruegeria sp.]